MRIRTGKRPSRMRACRRADPPPQLDSVSRGGRSRHARAAADLSLALAAVAGCAQRRPRATPGAQIAFAPAQVALHLDQARAAERCRMKPSLDDAWAESAGISRRARAQRARERQWQARRKRKLSTSWLTAWRACRRTPTTRCANTTRASTGFARPHSTSQSRSAAKNWPRKTARTTNKAAALRFPRLSHGPSRSMVPHC